MSEHETLFPGNPPCHPGCKLLSRGWYQHETKGRVPAVHVLHPVYGQDWAWAMTGRKGTRELLHPSGYTAEQLV